MSLFICLSLSDSISYKLFTSYLLLAPGITFKKIYLNKIIMMHNLMTLA